MDKILLFSGREERDMVGREMKDLKKKDLLVDIAALAGFYYLSDIRQERSRGAVCIALQQIASENYSCAE